MSDLVPVSRVQKQVQVGHNTHDGIRDGCDTVVITSPSVRICSLEEYFRKIVAKAIILTTLRVGAYPSTTVVSVNGTKKAYYAVPKSIHEPLKEH